MGIAHGPRYGVSRLAVSETLSLAPPREEQIDTPLPTPTADQNDNVTPSQASLAPRPQSSASWLVRAARLKDPTTLVGSTDSTTLASKGLTRLSALLAWLITVKRPQNALLTQMASD